MLLFVGLAFGLRLLAIDRQDIWGDEAFSIWLSRQPLPQVVAGGADTHPPLYPFLLAVWLRLAGSSPLAVRALSAYIGTLTVPVVYALGRRTFGRAAGALSALLAALSPALVYYSQETRMYGLATLLAAVSVYCAMRWYAARSPSKPMGRASGLPYLLVSLGAVYTHYYAFFAILAEDLVLIPALLRRRQWAALRAWLAGQGVIALAYVPWIVVQSRFLSGKASARFEELELASALRIAGQTVTAFGAGLAVRPGEAWAVTALFLIAIAAGLGAVLRSRQRQAGPWLVIAWLAVPLALAWVANPVMPFFYARYLLLIAPAFYLLAARGVVGAGRLPGRLACGVPCACLPCRVGQGALGRPLLRWVGAAVLLAGSAYGLHGYYTRDEYVKGHYGQMMAYARAHALPGDGLLLANPLQRPIFEYYAPPGFEAEFFPRSAYPLEDARTAADLEAIAARHPRLWLVRFGNPAEYDPTRTLDRWLATHGSKAYFGGWGDADLALYVMAPAGVGSTIQHPLQADLGDGLRLLGYALSANRVKPGDTLLLTLYWQARAPMTERYNVFTHLLDNGNRIQAQMDSEPQGGGLPTDRWTVGQVIQDNYALTISPGATPGPHFLEVGMYLLPSGDRLPVRDPATGEVLGDRVLLDSVEMEAP